MICKSNAIKRNYSSTRLGYSHNPPNPVGLLDGEKFSKTFRNCAFLMSSGSVHLGRFR